MHFSNWRICCSHSTEAWSFLFACNNKVVVRGILKDSVDYCYSVYSYLTYPWTVIQSLQTELLQGITLFHPKGKIQGSKERMVAELNPCFYILRVRKMFSFSPLSFPPLQQPQNSQLPEPSKQQWRWTWRFPAKWQERLSVNERDHFVSKRRKLQRWTTVCTTSPVGPFTENITCKTSGLCCSMLG